jgi:hypothetical protein
MFNLKDLEKFFGKATMNLNGIEFKLIRDKEMSGESAVWVSEDYRILATPDFDTVPVPVEVMEFVDGDWNIVGAEGYYKEINSFEEYVNAVRDLTKKIFEDQR